MYGYDPRTGKELWKVQHGCYSAAARPVYFNGLTMMCTGVGKKNELLAIKVDGQGDVTGTHVTWRTDMSVPRTPSPIIVGDLLYLLTDDGTLTCMDAKTGKQVWQERIRSNYCASPIYADGRIYFFSNQGKATIIKPGNTFQLLGTNTLESGLMASPAILGKALILRTKTHLYRVEDL